MGFFGVDCLIGAGREAGAGDRTNDSKQERNNRNSEPAVEKKKIGLGRGKRNTQFRETLQRTSNWPHEVVPASSRTREGRTLGCTTNQPTHNKTHGRLLRELGMCGSTMGVLGVFEAFFLCGMGVGVRYWVLCG